jgi:NADH:ubiquinone oxidoreductase subunit K
MPYRSKTYGAPLAIICAIIGAIGLMLAREAVFWLFGV